MRECQHDQCRDYGKDAGTAGGQTERAATTAMIPPFLFYGGLDGGGLAGPSSVVARGLLTGLLMGLMMGLLAGRRTRI